MFWKPLSKEISGKGFLAYPPQNDGPVKFLNGNHHLKASIFKLHKYQTFGLLKMHNSKTWFANNKFSLWNSSVDD